jgi:hypothetical protein
LKVKEAFIAVTNAPAKGTFVALKNNGTVCLFHHALLQYGSVIKRAMRERAKNILALSLLPLKEPSHESELLIWSS